MRKFTVNMYHCMHIASTVLIASRRLFINHALETVACLISENIQIRGKILELTLFQTEVMTVVDDLALLASLLPSALSAR